MSEVLDLPSTAGGEGDGGSGVVGQNRVPLLTKSISIELAVAQRHDMHATRLVAVLYCQTGVANGVESKRLMVYCNPSLQLTR